MKLKYFLTSSLTMGVLFTFLALTSYLGIRLGYGHHLPKFYLGFLILYVLLWSLSPTLLDLSLDNVYESTKLSWPEFETRYPKLSQFVKATCQKHNMSLPQMRVIHDKNPTAFCYGLGRWNARLVASDGIFKYLTEDEVIAVYAHELGHVANRDFILMTIATAVLTILYMLYELGKESSKESNNAIEAAFTAVGTVAFIFYQIGTYILLALNRTRELMADQFSAEETGNPNLLSLALVKIGYGITKAAQTSDAKNDLLLATRTLGIMDPKVVSALTNYRAPLNATTDQEPTRTADESTPTRLLEKLFFFDLFNPWAWITELTSTHPLTSRRILCMNRCCKEFNILPSIDLSRSNLDHFKIDKTRLQKGFFIDIFMAFLPFGLALIPFLLPYSAGRISLQHPVRLALIGFGVGQLILTAFMYPSTSPEQTNVFELMSNPYTSPIRGKPVELSGKIIGRETAGNILDSNMVIEDNEGRLALKYESAFPIFGNLLFGWRAKKIIGQSGISRGWFRRSITGKITLSELNTESTVFISYSKTWSTIIAVLFIIIGLFMNK